MSRNTVDIIIATYNRSDLLQAALKSIQNQIFSNWKCWIAEDGKTQETLDAIKPFLEDKRFVYFPGEHAGYPAGPRNRAIREGNAKYVAILDDDDFWLPEKLECQTHFLETHPNCVLLGCNAFRWSGTGSWNTCPFYFKKFETREISYKNLLDQNPIIHSSAVAQRRALEWTIADPYLVYRETPLTYYSTLNRSQNYHMLSKICESALNDYRKNKPSPLSLPENARLSEECKRKMDFYLAGPRFLGRFRHELASTIRTIISPY